MLKMYLPSWLGPLLWPMHEQRLVHLFDCYPIVLAVKRGTPCKAMTVHKSDKTFIASLN